MRCVCVCVCVCVSVCGVVCVHVCVGVCVCVCGVVCVHVYVWCCGFDPVGSNQNTFEIATRGHVEQHEAYQLFCFRTHIRSTRLKDWWKFFRHFVTSVFIKPAVASLFPSGTSGCGSHSRATERGASNNSSPTIMATRMW